LPLFFGYVPLVKERKRAEMPTEEKKPGKEM